MAYKTSAARAAYVAGVRAALDEGMVRLPGAAARAMEAWLADLDAWTAGPPPPSPRFWRAG